MTVERLRLQLPDFTLRELVYPAGTLLRRHAHPFANVTAVLCGSVLETTERGERLGRSGSVVVKPAGFAHENRMLGRAGALTLALEIPAHSPLARRLERPWAWRDDLETARCATRLAVAVRMRAPRARIAREGRALIEAALGPAPGPAEGATGWVEELRALLERSHPRTLRFGALAQTRGIDPSQLARTFRRAIGSSMGQYVRSVRLREARHLLASSAWPARRIADDCGFADPSHLCRALTEALGMGPRDYRRLTRPPPVQGVQLPPGRGR